MTEAAREGPARQLEATGRTPGGHWGPAYAPHHPGSRPQLRLLGRGEPVQRTLALPVERWHGPILEEELFILRRSRSPVLDIGCGPGRHVAALVRSGRQALGIDPCRAAVEASLSRGAPAIQGSVFGPVPEPGSWATALLIDGNIGIGGDPATLLARVWGLLAADGIVLVELDPPHVRSARFEARVEHAGAVGADFPWAALSVCSIDEVAGPAGFEVEASWGASRETGRWFAQLRRVSDVAIERSHRS